MPLACRSLKVFSLLFGQIRAYELSAITLHFPLQRFFSLSGQFRTYQLILQWSIPGRASSDLLCCLSGSLLLYRQTVPRRLPATTRTTVLVTPGTRCSQRLGRYTDKITHGPATSPFPTFIKTGSSYLMWTVHTVLYVSHDVCQQPNMPVSLCSTHIESEHERARVFHAAWGH